MKWWIVLLVAIGATVVHFVITFTSMICLLWSALGPVNWMGRILASLFIPLGFPATFIIGRWTDGLIGLSNEATLGLLIASSALWGAALALLWKWWRARRASRPVVSLPMAP